MQSITLNKVLQCTEVMLFLTMLVRIAMNIFWFTYGGRDSNSTIVAVNRELVGLMLLSYWVTLAKIVLAPPPFRKSPVLHAHFLVYAGRLKSENICHF